MMKYIITILTLLCLLLMLTGCQAGSDSSQDNDNPAGKNDHRIQYRFASREEGQKLLMSNTKYHDGFTENDLQFRMQNKDATMEEYLSFAKDQVLDFRDEQKTLISKAMDRLDEIITEKKYQFPPVDEITFVCTTMKEECNAAAYTHGTQIYVNNSVLDYCIENGDNDSYMLFLMAHELFHCLTRCNPDFRTEMYKLIHFTVQKKEYALPPSVLEYYISNPDVGHHDAWASFEIHGKPIDCYMAFATRKHFEKEGDRFFDTGSAVLVPVDGSDKFYYPEEAANYYEILGENTEYTIDPEECMADNFALLINYDQDGPEGEGYKTREIIDGIREYLQEGMNQ